MQDKILTRVRIQHPTYDPQSLQRSVTQIALLLQDREWYDAIISSAKSSETVAAQSSGGGSLPTGGTTGQVLTKLSNADGDAAWEDIVLDGGGASP